MVTIGLVRVVRAVAVGCRVDEEFRRRGGGWYVISGSELVLVGPAFTAEKSVTIGCQGRAAASPDGKLLAVAGTDTLTVFDDRGDLVATVLLRRWPDGSGSAVAFSADGTCLLAVCAGEVRGTAEIRKIDGGAGWATTAAAAFPVTNDVYPSMWALPHQSGYLVSIGAGQDGQWSWWVSDDGALTATEIKALRDRAVHGVTRDTALSVPWAYGEEFAWHDLPSGNVIRRLDAGAIVGEDDSVQYALDLGDGCLAVVTGEGHVLKVDQPEGRPIVAARLSATEAQSPFGWAGGTVVTADELLLWDHDGGLALAALASHTND
jgi:hypothetical protein